MTVVATRALLRIARRNVGRNRWRSLLVGLLVFLPVAAMVGGLTFYRTITPTGEQRATAYMGRADILVTPVAAGVTQADLRATLPRGSLVEAILWADGTFAEGSAKVRATVRSFDPNGLAEGILRLSDGRFPATPYEAAVSRTVLTIAGTELGGTIAAESGQVWTVVGVVESPDLVSARVVLLHPSVAGEAPAGTPGVSWLVGLPEEGDEPLFEEMRFAAAFRWQAASPPGDVTIGMLVFGVLALTETALVAAAALTVGMRRRQRELGLLAAAGATGRQLRDVVLAEGVLIGGAAALGGAAIGFFMVVGASPLFDSLVDRRVGSVVFDSTGILLAVGLGVLSAVVAAWLPARTAARVPVLMALSGRRPPMSPARRTLFVGLVLAAVATLLIVVGSATMLANRYSAQSSDPGFFMLLAGAILGFIGFGAMSPFVVERLEGISRRMPLAVRIALRDTARARTRSAAMVTAMLASMAFCFAAISFIASYVAIDTQTRAPGLLDDHVFVYGPDAVGALAEMAAAADTVAAAPLAQLVDPYDPEIPREFMYAAGPEQIPVDIGRDGDISCQRCAGAAQNVVVESPELLVALAAESAANPLAAHRIVLLLPAPLDVQWVTVVGPTGTQARPATVVVAGYREGFLPGAIVSAATAEELGLVAGTPDSVVLRLRHKVNEADVSRIGAAAGAGIVSIEWAEGPASRLAGVRTVAVVTALILALTIVAIAVALGESESRPDQRTLLAVGASPRIRRRIAAARAAVLALLASTLALPAGLLPIWGVMSGMNSPFVVPIPELAAAMLLLPIVAIAGALLLSRSIPQWSAFRDVAHE
ncbi:hypothetical protein BH24CHL6_BH24CHL6_09280 [soil metagenome]